MGCQTASSRQRSPLASIDGGRGNPVPDLAAASGPPHGAGHRPTPAGMSRDGRPGRWLAAAMVSLAVLAAAAAAVSFAAQYRMVLAAKGSAPVAGLEAGIPDVAALIFATLGIALALHGKRAIRARVLNVAAVGTSVLMNALAAAPGWRAAAIWVMPPVAYAIASDTLIGVVRAHAIARHKALNAALAEDDATPLAIVGGLLLWLLRLLVAPVSTLGGFRAWVVEECPVAPGRRAEPVRVSRAPRPPVTTARANAIPAIPARSSHAGRGSRAGSKTARFLALVATRHGPLEAFPIGEVSQVSAELAPEVGLNPGAARAALRRRILALQNGSGQ
ncbi:MAG: hypothetical protein ACYCO9_10190 [Streptosporangiaceae bacterium]